MTDEQVKATKPDDTIACVISSDRRCLAKVPIACVCAKMPKHVYLEAARVRFGEEDA